MTSESRHRKRLRKDISRHISSGNPGSRERAVEDMVTNEMVTDINVLGTGRDSRSVRERTRSLVVAKNWERARIVLDMGNPRVKFTLSLPIPVNTRTHVSWVRVLAGFRLGTGKGI